MRLGLAFVRSCLSHGRPSLYIILWPIPVFNPVSYRIVALKCCWAVDTLRESWSLRGMGFVDVG